MRELRALWQHVHIIYNKSTSSSGSTASSSSNVLLLQSSQLSELIDVLSSVDDSIDIHPRQIRRILRRALDSNIVKDIATSRPDSFLSQPIFNKSNNEYILRVKHYEKENKESESGEEKGTICFDFYFGVPKSYYFQIKSITNLSNKENMMQDHVSETMEKHKKKNNNNISRNNNKESPFKTVIGFATNNIETKMQRINSKSIQSRSSIAMDTTLTMDNDEENEPQNEGIEMTEITANIDKKQKKTDRKHMITLQTLIPNEFVHHDFVESKCGENNGDISFFESDLERTINTIIGNIKKRELIKKRGPTTKYKKYIINSDDDDNTENADDSNDDGLYFCVLLSYIRYRINNKETENEKGNIVSNLFKKKRTENESESEESEEHKEEKIYNDNDNEYEFYEENGIHYKVSTLEISIYDPPSAFLPRNQYSKQSKKKNKKKGIDSVKTMDDNIAIENALEPALCYKLLCDFKLQRLVEYYDIFGISCDVENLDCKICFSFPVNIVLLPCRHCCCCVNCYKHIEQCPMCRKPIRQTLRWNQQ